MKQVLKKESFAELNQVAQGMIENKQSIFLRGHADAVGEYVYNWHLSKHRGDSVKAYLVNKGVDSSKIADNLSSIIK